MTKVIASILLVSVFVVSSGFLQIANAQMGPLTESDTYKSKCLQDTGLGLLSDKIIDFISGAVNSALSFISFGLFGESEKKVSDTKAQTIALKADLKSCIKYVTDVIFKAALATFKKKLLDKLTDDVVNWIQNGGEPRFVSDFGGFLEETANETLGQTAEEVGLGQLCSGSLSARLQLQLASPPRFTQSVNCTLNDIVRNVGNFDRDFRSGGWIGYNEILKPQNNRWGLELMTLDQYSTEQRKKIESARNETVAGGGYTSEKQCLAWKRSVTYGYDGHTEEEFMDITRVTPPSWNEAYYNPRNTPPVTLPRGAVSATDWVCDELQVTIPSRTVADLSGTAIQGNDPLAIANSDDLTPYISAIFDAAINRLFKEGVRGLRGDGASTGIYSESGTGRAPTNWASSTDPRERRYGDYGRDFGDASNPIAKLKSEILATIASTTARMRVASSTILSLVSTIPSASVLFPIAIPQTHYPTLIMATSTRLATCEQTKAAVYDPVTGLPLPGAVCPKTETLIKDNAKKADALWANLDAFRETSSLLNDARTATNDPNITEVSLISILAAVSQAYSQVENIISSISRTFIADMNSVLTSYLNPYGRACALSPAPYSCP